jgi:gliding motility-associated-like protein
MTLSINRQAIANAGPDATICETSTYTLSGSTAQYYSTLTWTSSGTGTFSNATLLHPVYTPSAADIAAGTVTLTLQANANAPCTNVTSSMTLSISRQSIANAGPNETICETSTYTLSGSSAQYYSTLNWTTSGTGTFSNATVLHPIYTPSATDIFNGSVTLTLTANSNAPCINVTSSMVLTIHREPIASAGSNASVCASSPQYTLSGASASNYTTLQWTTSGTGSFTPNATVLNPSYTPSAADIAAGSVILTLTANAAVPCTNAISSMTLTINTSATASIGVSSATICQGMNYSLSLATVSNNNGLLWTTSGTGTFSNPAALNPIYTPSTADINNGSVTLTLTAYGDAPCGNATSTMTLNINKAPLANAGPNGTICQGSTYSVSGASASNYASILWTMNGTGTLTNATTLTPTYIPGSGETGIVTLTLTASPNTGCTTAAVSTMTITINGTATASAGPNATICEGSQYTLSGSAATNYSSLHWTTTGTGSFDDVTLLHPIYTPSLTDIAAGSVILTLQVNANAPCTNVTSSMTLSITRQAIANAGPNAAICETSTYTLSNSTAQYYASINWTTSGTGIFSNATILHPVYTPSAADITSGSVILTLNLVANVPCANSSSSMTLNISRQPVANAGPNATICETTTYTLSNSTAQYYSTLLWTTSGTGTFSNAAILHPIYTPSAADIAGGTVTLTIQAFTNAPCNNVTSSMTLGISRQAIANAGPDATICETSTYTITGSSGQNYTSINWTTLGTGSFLDPTILHPVYLPGTADITAGNVKLVMHLTSTSPCVSATDTMVLYISRQPIANAGPNATICETSTYILSNATASYFTSLLWTTSGTGTFSNTATLNPDYTPSAADIIAGSVILTLQANANAPCNNVTTSMTLNITRQAIANAGPNATICETSTYTLSNSTAQYYVSINWTTSGTGTFSNATVLHPIYSPSAADIAAGSVMLTLNLVANVPCSNTSSSMTLSITRQAIANAGPNATICETSTYTLSNSTAQYYSTLSWTTSGTGTFNNATVLHPVYTPSAADITAGSVVLTLQANANAPCNNVTSSMTLNITRQAIAYAGPNATICETSTYILSNSTAQYYSTLNWTTTGTGTFSNATILHPVYTPSAADIASGSITLTLNLVANGPCTNTSSSMMLSISRQPVANAGPNATICETTTYTLSNSTAQYYSTLLWTTSGTGTFNNTTVLHPVYTPSATDIAGGTVTLTLQANANAPCNNVTSAMTLSITRQAIGNAGTNATICETSTYTLSNSTAQYYASINWTTSGTGIFSNATILHPVYTPSAADIASGSVMLTLNLVANVPCANTSSSMTLSISRQPVANAGPNATICETTNYTLSNSTAQYYSSLIWTTSGTGTFSNAAILHPIYTPSAADIAGGTVTLTLQANANAPCNNVTSSMTLSITRQAIAYAGPNATICETSTYTLSNSTAQYYSTLSWTTTGTGTFSNATILHPVYTPSAADIASGSVTLTLNLIANVPCTNTSSSMTLSISRQPVANAGPNATICETTTYTLSNSTAQYYSTLNWTTSGTGIFNNAAILHPIYTPSAADIAAGSVILTLQANANAPCNNVTSSMTLSITRQAIAYAGPNATICESSTYTLSNSTAQYYVSINWTTSGTGTFSNATVLHPIYSPSAADIAAGNVMLTLNLVANVPCSNTSSSMTLSISRQPVANAGPNATICETTTYTLSNSTAQYYSTLSWTTSGTGIFNNAAILHPIYTPSTADIAAGSVILTLQANANAPCNNVTSSMTLSITRQAIAYAGPNATICETSTYTLSNSTAQYYSTLSWTTSGTGTFSNATILHPVYTPSAADIASGSVTLTLNLIANVPCANTSSTMTLSISRQPVVNAGPNATICETTIYTLSNSTAQYYSTLLWTTSGTGTFNNTTVLHPVYTPSAADIAGGTVTLTLQANANAPCNNVTSSMTLSITRQAIANAGPNATICETSTYTLSNSTAQYYLTLNWTTSGTGTFSNATILHPVYTPSAADIAAGSVILTLNLVANVPCSNTSSSMTLSISRQPVANAGPNATICETTNYTLSNSAAQYYSSLIWTTSGTGAFSNSGILHPVYTPSAADIAAGSVILTLQANANAPCNNVTSSMTLSITRQAIANAGPNATICETSTYTLSNSTAQYYLSINWTTSGTGTFSNATVLHPIYTPSAADIAAGSVTLTLNLIANAPCANTSSSMILSISRQAITSAGPNSAICEGSTYQLNNSTAQFATTINWTSSGTGTFNNPAILHPIYTPSTADILGGTVILTITVTSNPPCAGASSSMTLTINRAPVANAGPNSSTCQGVPFIVTSASAQYYSSVLWTAPGPGVLTNANTLNPTYTPGPTQTGPVVLTLTVYGNAPCGSATSQMTLNIVPAPIASAGPNSSICEGSQFTVLGSSASNYISLHWTTSGTGTFVDATVLHPIYTPSSADITAGSVVLTLQANGNAPCTSVLSSMTLTIVRAPVANAGPDGTTCQNQAFTVSGATAQYFSSLLWTDNGSGTLSGAGTLTPTYYPAPYETGPVTLTLTVTGNAPCGSVSSQMTLTIVPSPIADAGPDATICEGSTYTVTGASAFNYAGLFWTSNGMGTLTNSTTLSPTYIPGTNEVGTVTLTLTVIGINPCGDAIDFMLLNITPKATANAGPDISSCASTPVTLAAATASNYTSLDWTTSGSGTFNNPNILNPIYTPSPADILNGNVVLTLTANAGVPCPAASDDMKLTISKEAVANAGPDQSTCEGASYMIMGASAQNYTSLLWTDNGMGTLTGSNTLTPIYTPAAGETGQVTLTLTVTPVAPCPVVTDQMVLTISKSATANAGPDATNCAGSPFILSGASATNYQSVTWTTSGTGTFDNPHAVNPVYTPSEVDILTGAVVLTMTIDPIVPCAVASAHMTLTLTGTPVADAGPNGSDCPGVAYAITGATAINYSSILWTTNGLGVLSGSTTLTPTYTPLPGESGTINLTLTIHGTGGCSSTTATSQMNIVISNPITVNAGSDQTIPRNSSTTLLGLASGGSGVYAFSWQPASLLIGASTDHPETVKLGDNVTFILTVTDVQTGCQSTDSVKVLINQGIEAIIAMHDRDTTGVNIPINVKILANDVYSKNLAVGVTLCGGPEHGLADVLSDNTINYTPDRDFSGIDSLCYVVCYNQYPDVCSATEVYIYISTQLPASWLIIHNVITPNGDGINDGWIIDGIEEFPDNNVLIFNRWGDEVKSFQHYDNTTTVWKGENYQGKRLPDGTYYYIITIKDGGSRTGWVLIRGSSK